MVNIRLKILDKGHIVQEQLIRVLQKHEDAIADNTSGDTSVGNRVSALETAIGSATGDNPSGLAHDVDDLATYIAEILTANDSLTDPRAESGDG